MTDHEPRLHGVAALLQAETFRTQGNFDQALLFAKFGLQELRPLTRKIVNSQALLIGGFARLIVDAGKSQARAAQTSEGVLDALEEVGGFMDMYHDPMLENKLRKSKQGRILMREMLRDEIKVMTTAAVLYTGIERGQLTRKILEKSQELLTQSDVGSPLHALVFVEDQLLRMQLQDNYTFDLDGLTSAYRTLVKEHLSMRKKTTYNEHRVTTVSSWLLAWEDKLPEGDFKRSLQEQYAVAIRKHADWETDMLPKHRVQRSEAINRHEFMSVPRGDLDRGRRQVLLQKLLAS